MRRAVAVAALLLLASPCLAVPARLLTVTHDDNASTPVANEAELNSNRMNRIFAEICRRWGVSTSFIGARQIKTIESSTGGVVRGRGTSSAFVDQYDAVAHISPVIGAALGTSYRADSTLRIAYPPGAATGGPTAYQLFLLGDYYGTVSGGQMRVTDATCCSTGVSEPTQQASPINPTANAMYRAGTYNAFISSGTYQMALRLNPTTPAGGIRKFISSGAYCHTSVAINPSPHNAVWLDSVLVWSPATTAGGDTVQMWSRLYNESPTTYPNAKEATFVYFDGIGAPEDSALVGLLAQSAEVDPNLMLCGLAHIDSLLDHRLITKTRTVGVEIIGLCSRGARLGARGFFAADSSVAYATMDSIRSLGIPVLYGVNADPDSMAAYSRDLIVALRNPMAKFTPMTWTGVDSTAAQNGGATKQHRPRDVWGMYRSRFAYGDGSCTGKDSSLTCGLIGQREVLDSVLIVLTGNASHGRLSATLIAPLDDWSPKNVRGVGNGPWVDSLVYAMRTAGYSACTIDGQDPAAIAGFGSGGRNNPVGFIANERLYPVLGSKQQIKFVAHPGYEIIGSSGQFIGTPGAYLRGIVFPAVNRAWTSWTQDRDFVNTDAWRPYDWNTYIDPGYSLAGTQYRMVDTFTVPKKASIVRFCINDFSGNTVAGGESASRWGWWVLKSLVNSCRTINEIDGRQIIWFGYPEDVTL